MYEDPDPKPKLFLLPINLVIRVHHSYDDGPFNEAEAWQMLGEGNYHDIECGPGFGLSLAEVRIDDDAFARATLLDAGDGDESESERKKRLEWQIDALKEKVERKQRQLAELSPTKPATPAKRLASPAKS
jgi:hypothetical protein